MKETLFIVVVILAAAALVLTGCAGPEESNWPRKERGKLMDQIDHNSRLVERYDRSIYANNKTDLPRQTERVADEISWQERMSARLKRMNLALRLK